MKRDPGVGQRPTVVMLHAFPCDHTLWTHQVAALSRRGFDVQAPDLPGFGRNTELPQGDPSLGAVVEVLRETYGGPLVVVGLSVGGYLAMEWLRQAPDQILGLALVGTKASADTPEGVEKRYRLAELVESDPTSTSRLLATAMTPTLVVHPERPDVAAALDGWFRAVRPATVAWYQRAMATRPDSFADLSRFSGPALVVWGSGDVLSPEVDQQAMCESLPHVSAVEIPDSGHLCALEQPELTTQILVDFLEMTFPRP